MPLVMMGTPARRASEVTPNPPWRGRRRLVVNPFVRLFGRDWGEAVKEARFVRSSCGTLREKTTTMTHDMRESSRISSRPKMDTAFGRPTQKTFTHPATTRTRASAAQDRTRACPMSASNFGKSAAKEAPLFRTISRPSCRRCRCSRHPTTAILSARGTEAAEASIGATNGEMEDGDRWRKKTPNVGVFLNQSEGRLESPFSSELHASAMVFFFPMSCLFPSICRFQPPNAQISLSDPASEQNSAAPGSAAALAPWFPAVQDHDPDHLTGLCSAERGLRMERLISGNVQRKPSLGLMKRIA